MRTSESIGKISAALVEALGEMGNAVKDSKNPFFKSSYADINSIREAAMPALQKCKITVLQPPAVYEGKNYIETVLIHESGEFLSSLNEVVVSKQNDPQSYLAAQTYTRRGALQAFLSMGSDDDDGNTASGKVSESSKAPLRASGFKASPAVPAAPSEPAPPELAKEGSKAEPAEAPAARRGSFGSR